MSRINFDKLWEEQAIESMKFRYVRDDEIEFACKNDEFTEPWIWKLFERLNDKIKALKLKRKK